MNPNDAMIERIKRASLVKYKKLCIEAQSKVDLEALKRELIEEAVESLQSFEFYFDGHDNLSYTHPRVSHIANDITDRIEREVFRPISKHTNDEMEDYLDLFYSRPTERDIQKILEYIQEGEVECSV
jgi:predicted PilT family ATPase